MDTLVGVRAGPAARPNSGSEMAVDAFTVAVADLEGGAIEVTTDVRDLKRLAVYVTRVVVADIR